MNSFDLCVIAPNSFTCVFQVDGGAAGAYSWHTPALREPYGISPCLAGKKLKDFFRFSISLFIYFDNFLCEGAT